jgi:hypothetical protein
MGNTETTDCIQSHLNFSCFCCREPVEMSVGIDLNFIYKGYRWACSNCQHLYDVTIDNDQDNGTFNVRVSTLHKFLLVWHESTAKGNKLPEEMMFTSSDLDAINEHGYTLKAYLENKFDTPLVSIVRLRSRSGHPDELEEDTSCS